MDIIIEPVANGEDEAAMLEVWAQVFGSEMGIRLAPGEVSGGGNSSHLLARLGAGGEPVGTLSVVDTSGDRELQEGYNLGFDAGARSARFMHLAVLRPFRGLSIPLMMALVAHRRIIVPRRYDYVWLLFDAERAPTSFLARHLGFAPKEGVFVSEYGRRRPLVRDERPPEAARAIREAEQYLKRCNGVDARAGSPGAPLALGV